LTNPEGAAGRPDSPAPREAWEREYAEIRAYTTSYRGDLDRGVHFLLDFVRSSGGRLAEPILDLGCGMGRNLLPLRSAGYRVVGVDHSATALERLRRTADGAGGDEEDDEGALRLVRHDLGQPLPLDTGSVGTILDVTAVDNLTDPDRLHRYGREAARVLRPGGLALVVTFAVDDGYYGPWLDDSPWAIRNVVEDPNTGIRNRLFVPRTLDAVFEPGLRREVAATLVFVDEAAGSAWTRRFLMHLYRKPGRPAGG